MRYLRSTILVILAVGIGCQPHPRFRTGGEERPAHDEPREPDRLTTNDSIRLGVIMQSYLGKSYASGSSYSDGVDCSEFVAAVFRKFDGRKLPRMSSEQYRLGTPVLRRNLRMGDLVFFKTDSRPISHVGIAVGSGEFIHASSSSGVIISKLSEEYWSRRYVGGRRILKPPSQDSR